jgi:hypothetical protein
VNIDKERGKVGLTMMNNCLCSFIKLFVIIHYLLNYPYVFGSTIVKSTGEVLENQAQLKATEKAAIERGDDPYA